MLSYLNFDSSVLGCRNRVQERRFLFKTAAEVAEFVVVRRTVIGRTIKRSMENFLTEKSEKDFSLGGKGGRGYYLRSSYVPETFNVGAGGAAYCTQGI